MSGDGASEDDPELPSVDDLKRIVDEEEGEFAERGEETYRNLFTEASASNEEAYIHLAGLEDHYKHKRYWSYVLMGIMGAMVLFQMTLLHKVGIGAWSFEKYEWLLPTLLAQNLAQIVGLAIFVVRALFRDVKPFR